MFASFVILLFYFSAFSFPHIQIQRLKMKVPNDLQLSLFFIVLLHFLLSSKNRAPQSSAEFCNRPCGHRLQQEGARDEPN